MHLHRNYTVKNSNTILYCVTTFVLTALLALFTGCSSPTESSGDGPGLSVDRTELSFGESLPEMTFTISNDGSGSLEWSVFVANGAPWCSATPGSGTGGSTITVTIDRTKMLSPGDYTTTITVNSNGGVRELKVSAVSSTGIIIIDTPLPE